MTNSYHATSQKSASCLARLAAALLGDAAHPERRDAGAKVLFGLASLAGRAQQQSPAALAATAEEALVAADVARDGATEVLRHAIALASPPASQMAEPPPALSASGACRSAGAGSGRGRDGEAGNVAGAAAGSGGRAGSEGGRAVQEWVLQTLAPLLQHPSGRETRKKNSSTAKRPGCIPIALPETRRKLSAAELKKSPAEVRTIELSAALGVADALLLLVQTDAPANPPPVRGAGRRGQEGKGPQPLLARLLLETPLAAGLLALACSGRAPARAEQDETTQGSCGTATASPSRTPPSRRRRPRHHHEQRNKNGGGGDAEGIAPQTAAAATAAATAADTADKGEVAATTADAALAIAREAAALCPEGLWVGLRAELLPALAGGSGSGSGSGPGSGSRSGGGGNAAHVDGGVGKGGGGVGAGVAGGVRAALVLKEVVGGMGTGVVPFAARLLPVALRGMTDGNEQVKTV